MDVQAKLQWLPSAIAWILLLVLQCTKGEAEEVCSHETFKANCFNANEVLLVTSAKYGRVRLGRCVKESVGFLGCSGDVLPVLDYYCTGRRSCEIDVGHSDLIDKSSCNREVTRHLYVEYSCIKVQATEHTCMGSAIDASFTSGYGFISTLQAVDSRLGTTGCPWAITAQAGQRLNISLFNSARYHIADAGQQQRHENQYFDNRCYEIGELQDGRHRKSITACVGETREQVLLLSTSNSVQLTISYRQPASEHVHFLIKYRAIGCANFEPPLGATAVRNGDTSVVRCNGSLDTYYLTCRNNRWIGAAGNCSLSNAGILIVVCIGVALGVFLGGLLLTSVIMCLRRKDERNARAIQNTGADAADDGQKYADSGVDDYATWTSRADKHVIVTELDPTLTLTRQVNPAESLRLYPAELGRCGYQKGARVSAHTYEYPPIS